MIKEENQYAVRVDDKTGDIDELVRLHEMGKKQQKARKNISMELLRKMDKRAAKTRRILYLTKIFIATMPETMWQR